MKVRLIQPAQLDENGQPTKFTKIFFPMLTLPTLAGYTPSGIDVAITMEYVEDIDFDENVDLVGITSLTCQATRAYQIAAEFRKRGVPVVMGGIHATACPDEAGQHTDAVCVGEAEEVWGTILEDARRGQLKRIYKGEERPDLADLPPPRFDLLDFNQYVIPPFARTPAIPIQTTRGCPNDCDFCSVSRYLGRKLRSKPVPNVLREIEAVNPSRVFFVDDNIAARPKYFLELCDALKSFKLRWACQMSSQILKRPDLIDAAAEAGCHECFMGLESLSQEGLCAMNKGFNNVDNYKQLMKRLSDVGILAQVSLMVGMDTDTVEGLRRSVEAVLDFDVNYLYLAILTPLPGTRMREKLLETGRVLNERSWENYDFAHVAIDPKQMTVREVEDMIWEMYQKFYSLPNILRRAWKFKTQYLRFFPRDNLVEETYFQLHQRRAVNNRKFPFTLGLQREGAA